MVKAVHDAPLMHGDMAYTNYQLLNTLGLTREGIGKLLDPSVCVRKFKITITSFGINETYTKKRHCILKFIFITLTMFASLKLFITNQKSKPQSIATLRLFCGKNR